MEAAAAIASPSTEPVKSTLDGAQRTAASATTPIMLLSVEKASIRAAAEGGTKGLGLEKVGSRSAYREAVKVPRTLASPEADRSAQPSVGARTTTAEGETRMPSPAESVPRESE
ncbi:MAG: hypothetical protein B7Z66_15005 [Chromatiales bacterium 21-64-14]|nr:MAG: hypothetical protein B7Z66_15005 [Chromatiales bacterium 21-64-14]